MVHVTVLHQGPRQKVWEYDYTHKAATRKRIPFQPEIDLEASPGPTLLTHTLQEIFVCTSWFISSYYSLELSSKKQLPMVYNTADSPGPAELKRAT